jgi:hypothetical protein
MFAPFRVGVWAGLSVYKFVLGRVCVFTGEHVDVMACRLVREFHGQQVHTFW